MKKFGVILSIVILIFALVQTALAEDFHLDFDDIESVDDLNVETGSGLLLENISISNLDFDGSGQSIKITGRKGYDYRLKFLDAISDLTTGKKYYISMYATINDNANVDKGSFYLGVYSPEEGVERAVYNDNDALNTAQVVTKKAWVKLGLVYTVNNETANVIGIEQVCPSGNDLVVSDINIDNVSVIPVDDDFVPDDIGKTVARVSTAQEKLYDDFTKIAILKLDDLKAEDAIFTNIAKAKEILDEYGVKAGFGFIAKTFDVENTTEETTETDVSEYFDEIKSLYDDGMEIWNHGYAHTADEFYTTTSEEMYQNFKATQDLLYRNTGIEMKSFGAPGNRASSTFIEMLKENYPDFETLMFVGYQGISPFLHLGQGLDCETTTGRPSLDKFKGYYDNGTTAEYMVLQMHAPYFNDAARTQFEEIIKYCLDKGVAFMTPHEYYEYEKGIKLVVDRERLLCDVMPVKTNDGVLVPARDVFEKIGSTVSYDETTKTITAQNNDNVIKLTVGVTTAEVDGQEVKLDMAPTLINDRMLVYANSLSKVIDRTVTYDEVNNAVIVAEKTEEAMATKKDIISFEDFSSSDSVTPMVSASLYPTNTWEGSSSMLAYVAEDETMRIFSGNKTAGSQHARRGAVNAWPDASKPYKLVGKFNMQAIDGYSYFKIIDDAGKGVRTLFAIRKSNDNYQAAAYVTQDTTDANAVTIADGKSIPLTDWINCVFVLDVTDTAGTNTFTFYINGEKFETNISKDVITTGGYTKFRFQNGTNAQAYVDNIGMYYSYSDNLPEFVASYDNEKVDTVAGKAKISFSNEIYIENFRDGETDNSVISIDGVSVPMSNIFVSGDNMSLYIDGSLFTKGKEHTVSIGDRVKDVLGTSISGETTFSVVAAGQSVEENVTMKAFSQDGDGYVNYVSDAATLKDTFVPIDEYTASSLEYDTVNRALKLFDAEKTSTEQAFYIAYKNAIPSSTQAPYTVIGKLNYTMLDEGEVSIGFLDDKNTINGTLLSFDNSSISITADNGSKSNTKKIIDLGEESIIGHKYEILYKIDVLNTTGENKVTMWIDDFEYSSTYSNDVFADETASMCFLAPNGGRVEIDNFEVYTMIGSKQPLVATFDNLFYKENDIYISFSNEIAVNMLAANETDSVITIKDADDNITNIPLDKVSVSGDAFKTLKIEKSAFASQDGYTVDVSAVKDINSTFVSQNTSDVVSAKELAKVSTTFDGIFVGGETFSVTKKIKNFSSTAQKVNVIGAIYDKSDALVDIVISDNDLIDATSTEEFVLDFGILDSNIDETYKIKIFVWNENMKSYLATEEIKDKYKQIAILKFDDLYVANMPYFQLVKDLVDECKVPASFGAICKNFESATSDNWDTLASWQNDGIELWHHGYASAETEYNVNAGGYAGVTTNYDTMLENFKNGYDLFYNHGITFATFGSPNNNADATFVQMMDENYVGKINTLLLVGTAENDTNFLTITKRISIENPTGTMNYESFKADFDADNGQSPVFVMQAHPARWINDSAKAKELKDAIEYAISNDVMFMTPQRYFEYQKTIK